MSIQMAIPFGLAADGSIAVVTDPDQQIADRVRAIVGTQPGERLMRPDLGVPLLQHVFDDDDDLVESQLRSEVTQVLGVYEPGVTVRDVNPVADVSGDGIASVEVSYARTEAPTTAGETSKFVNSAIIKIGGTVEEVILG